MSRQRSLPTLTLPSADHPGKTLASSPTLLAMLIPPTRRARLLTFLLALTLTPILSADAGTTLPRPRTGHPGNVFLEHDDIKLDLPRGAADTWTVTDYEGRPVLTGQALGDRAVIPELPVGYYELRRDGVAQPAIPIAVLRRLRAPTPPSSPIGIDIAMSWLYKSEADMRTAANLAALAGVNWSRDRLNFAELEPERDRFVRPGKYDLAARIQSEAGLRVLQVNHVTPPWAGKDPKRFPDDLRDVFNFYAEMSRRFKGRVNAFEPWNEADIPQFGGHTGAEIASFQRAAYLGLKAGFPQTLVCSTALAKDSPAVLEDLYDNQLSAYFDTWNFHHYVPFIDYPRVYTRHRAVSAGKPLWVTECSLPVQWSGDETKKEPSPDALRTQAERVAKVYASAIHEGAEQVFYFMLPHYAEGQTQFGLLRPDLTPRPAYVALAAVGRLLADARPLGLWTEHDDVVAYAFSTMTDGQPTDVLVAWSTTPSTPSDSDDRLAALPKGRVSPTRPTEIPFALETRAVYDLLGRPITLTKHTLPLTSSPVFVLMPPGQAKRLPLRQHPQAPTSPDILRVSPIVLQPLLPPDRADHRHSAYTLDPRAKSSTVPVYIYNLSSRPARGLLILTGPVKWTTTFPTFAELQPFERKELTLTIDAHNDRFTNPETLQIRGDFMSAGRPFTSFRFTPTTPELATPTNPNEPIRTEP